MRFSFNNNVISSSYNVYTNGNEVKSIDDNDVTVWEKGKKLTFSLSNTSYKFPAKTSLSTSMDSSCRCAEVCFDQGLGACFIPYRNSKCCYKPSGYGTGSSQYYTAAVSCIQMSISSESAIVCIVPTLGTDECANFTVSLAATNKCTGASCKAEVGNVVVSIKECATTSCQTVSTTSNSQYDIRIATKRVKDAGSCYLGDYVKAGCAYWTVCGCVTSPQVSLTDYLHQNTYSVYVNGNLCCSGLKYKDFDGLEINIV